MGVIKDFLLFSLGLPDPINDSFSYFNIKLNTCRHRDYLFEQIF